MPTSPGERATAALNSGSPRSYFAYTANAPESPSDTLYVTIPAFDGGEQLHGPCDWEPRISDTGNALLPAQGVPCAVLDDEEQDLYVIYWDQTGATELPGSAETVTTRTHEQTTAANPWIINHGLGRYPVGLEAFDSYGEQVEGDVVNTDTTTTITWSGAMTGRATYI